MDLMEARRRVLIDQPHPVTLSGALVHFQTDMDGLMQITGTGNITVCGRNLFDKAAATQGKYIKSDGSIGNTSSGWNWSMTDFIPVTGGGTVKYTGISSPGSAPYSAWYDASKNLISTWKQVKCETSVQTVSVPATAAYMRMSVLMHYGSAVYDENRLSISNGADTPEANEGYTGSTSAAGTARKSLVGINNVFSDSGNITVTYWTH